MIIMKVCRRHSTLAEIQLTLVVQAAQLHAADLLAAPDQEHDVAVPAACSKRSCMLNQVKMGKSRAGLSQHITGTRTP